MRENTNNINPIAPGIAIIKFVINKRYKNGYSLYGFLISSQQYFNALNKPKKRGID